MINKLYFLSLILLVAFLSLISCPVPEDTVDNTWIIGYWVLSSSYAPYTNVIDFNADGNYYEYNYYDGTGLFYSSTWSLDGDILTISGMLFEITKVNNNQFSILGTPFYRKGTEPGGDIFSQSETVLSANAWTVGNLSKGELMLFSFTVPSPNTYDISWNDSYEGSGAYTGDIVVSAYEANQTTSFFESADSGWTFPRTVTLTTNEKIYIIADAYFSGGTFAVRIQ